MMLLLLQADTSYGQFGVAGAVLVIVGMILGFLLRALPTWREVKGQDKEVKLAEISVREKEAEARTTQATSFSQLSEVLNNVAVKQRQEIEESRLMQRVAADTGERMEEMVNQLVESVDHISTRLDSLELQLQQSER